MRQAFAPAKPAYMPSIAIRARKNRAEKPSVYAIREALSTVMTQPSRKKYIPVSSLHVPSVLPANLKQRVGNFAQRAKMHGVDQFGKNIAVVDSALTNTLERGG